MATRNFWPLIFWAQWKEKQQKCVKNSTVNVLAEFFYCQSSFASAADERELKWKKKRKQVPVVDEKIFFSIF